MKQLFSISFLFLFSYALLAQTPPPPPPPPVEEEIIMEEEAPVFIDQSIDIEESVDYNSNYGRNSQFTTSTIFDIYEWVYERNVDSYKRTYGILKKGELLLPMIFKANLYHTNKKQLVLGLGQSYGIYNLETEEWDVPLQYTSIQPLSKNIYSAKRGAYAGIIDGNDNIIVPFKWYSISQVSGLENYLLITDVSKPIRFMGIYNVIAGKFTVEPKYRSLTKLSGENYFKVQDINNEYNIIDIQDKPRFKKWYSEITVARGGRKFYIVKENGRMGIIDEDENEIVPIEYPFIKTYPYNDGSYLAKNKEGKYGCITIDGKITLPFIYDNLQAQNSNNVAITSKDDKCGIVQVNNGLPYEIATCDYDEITQNNKVFIIEQGGKFGIMDLYGKMKTDLSYQAINSISSDLLVGSQKGKWYLMDNDGKTLNTTPYKDIKTILDQEKSQSYYSTPKFTYLKVKHDNNKYGIMDKLGNEIIPPQFEDVLSESQNIVLAKMNGKFGLYNLLSKTEVLPYEYDQITLDQKGYYAFKGNEIYLVSGRGKVKIAKL